VYLLDEPIKPDRLMRPYGLYYLYRRRLRQHATQELLAGLGVAIAVALVFATLVANSSIAGSAARVVHRLIGPANLQLRTLGPDGFPERTLAAVERLQGVRQAAPMLEVPATIVSPQGRMLTVTVLGADISLGTLDGLAHTLPGAVFTERAVALSAASAEALHITRHAVEAQTPERVTIKLRGRAFPLKVSAVLGPETAGPLSGVLAAAMPLESLQALAGLKGRVSRILIQTRPGRRSEVRQALANLVAGRVAVAPADQDIALLDQALRPSDLASSFFAAVAALLGFLFAFNAVLMTVPERREQIARLRLGGARRSAIVQLLLFQAICLGIVASLVGLGAGYGLALAVFHQRPGYLAQAFVLGGGVVIGAMPPLLALAGGILATGFASIVPALDLRRGRALDAVYHEGGDPGNAIGRAARVRLGLGAGLLLALATAIFLLAPSVALVACVAVALAAVLAMPLVFAAVVGGAGQLAKRAEHLTVLPVSVMSLRRTTLRSLALVMTGTVALFGSVALAGARRDLLAALNALGKAGSTGADLHIVNPHDAQEVTSFLPDRDAPRIAHVPGVVAVKTSNDQFMVLGGRTIALFARPIEDLHQVVRTQITSGRASLAIRRLQQGGWITLSRSLAATFHVAVGDALDLPSPSGYARLRIAALTTNLGWPGGAILMSPVDYHRLWATRAVSALFVSLAPGAQLTRVQHAIEAVLGPASGLEVIPASVSSQRFSSLVGEGLNQLRWIAELLIAAAILAMAAALAATIWQQRPWLSGLRLSAVPSRRLRRILLMQAALMLGAGCLTGVVAGVYGEVLADAYLRRVTGFPVATLAAGWQPLEVFVLVTALALILAALPAWVASRAPLALALETE
jgi:putative ABC transport system permease protein